LYETIKGKRDLLKENKDREDANYWALKKEVGDLDTRFIALQQDKESFQ
jgi:hypothetical protein